jgi:hypothetical protein
MNVASRSTLIVCERTPRWAVAWRRLLGSAFQVQEHRSINQVDESLENTASAVLGIDVTGFAVERVVAAIDRWASRGRIVIALATPAYEDEILSLREAGAAHVVLSTRQLPPVAKIVARRFAPAGVPAETSSSLVDGRLVANLPWEKYARVPR